MDGTWACELKDTSVKKKRIKERNVENINIYIEDSQRETFWAVVWELYFLPVHITNRLNVPDLWSFLFGAGSLYQTKVREILLKEIVFKFRRALNS